MTDPIKLIETLVMHPIRILIGVLLFVALTLPYVGDLQLDISTDSLILENDKDLEFYRSIRAKYGSDDYLLITYTPKHELFSEKSFLELEEIQKAILEIKRVQSITSMLTVPLLESPPLSLTELKEGSRDLRDPKTDIELAEKELRNSSLFKNQLVSADGKTTVLQVIFSRDDRYYELREARDKWRVIALERKLTEKERALLEQNEKAFRAYSEGLYQEQASDVERIRQILSDHQENASLYLGGVPMIVTDMMSFIWRDLKVFGLGVLLSMAALLWLVFRNIRWVFLPLLTASATVITMIGILGFLGWRITVVSSNFVSLILIFSVSLSVHLIVRYRELATAHPDAEHKELVKQMILSKFTPCCFTVITTMVAFSSLLVSGIRPVIDFGAIMCVGLVISLLFSFTLFPSLLALFPRAINNRKSDFTGKLTSKVRSLLIGNEWRIIGVSILLAVVCTYGMGRLTVENRFIDYFHQSTEIYKGMELIDQKLGGTTPLDIIIDAPEENAIEIEEEDFFGDEIETSLTATSFWFNEYMLEQIGEAQQYLESLPEVGKVLSLITGLEVIERLNDGKSLETFELGVLYNRLPDKTKETLIAPYLSEDGNQLRISMRLNESYPGIQRTALLNKIHRHLIDHFEFTEDQVKLTGMAVLYNNMLQSLFRSQILTLGTVFLVIMLTFALLFRSFWIALIAIVPNVLSAVLVLGTMGLAGIPLDIMTITIAAIAVGIAVDDTIHYVHRYGEEVAKDGDYSKATARSHNTIGRAMYYTTITIMIGFSILVSSNFIPTIYFGILTALAMCAALLADLFLLPVLLEKMRVYGKVASNLPKSNPVPKISH